MAIHSSFLGSVTISGDEAEALARKLTHARGTKAASEAAISGKKMVAAFVKNGSVTIELRKPVKAAQNNGK
jgi:hypothetical protein